MLGFGEDVSDWHFNDEITEPHEGFGKWMEENRERISNAKSLPYFLKDNAKYIESEKHGYSEKRRLRLCRGTHDLHV